MSKSFFIAGTDTGVGKTAVSCALLLAAANNGHTTLGLKPVASGCEATAQGLRNQDALLLQSCSKIRLDYEHINPYAFAAPIAPHVAAAQAGITIDLQLLQQCFYRAQEQQPDLLLVEGAGGWRTPLSASHSLADLAHRLRLPVILVVGMRLGCINHALLTAEAIIADGLPLAGWIANHCTPHMQQAEESLLYLQQKLPAPCLARIPYAADAPVQQLARYCDDWFARIP